MRKRTSKDRSARDIFVKKAMNVLSEEEGKEDIVHKVAKVIEDLTVKCNARAAVGDVYQV